MKKPIHGAIKCERIKKKKKDEKNNTGKNEEDIKAPTDEVPDNS